VKKKCPLCAINASPDYRYKRKEVKKDEEERIDWELCPRHEEESKRGYNHTYGWD